MIGQVMSATRGATDAFSGVSRHVNSAVSQICGLPCLLKLLYFVYLVFQALLISYCHVLVKEVGS